MISDEFLFLRPWVFWSLLLLPLYVGYRFFLDRVSYRPYAPLQYRPALNLRFLLPFTRLLLECLILALAVFILAGPHAEKTREMFSAEGNDIAFSLDVSSTMQAADFPPNRLEALKKITANFIRRSAGHRIALYVFARDVFTQTPLTSDRAVLLDLLDGLSYDIISHSQSGGTAIGDALLRSGQGLLRRRVKGRDQVVILITDGQNNFGIDPELSARYLRANNIRFYVIGIGKDELVPVYVRGKPFINIRNKHLHTRLDDRRLRAITEAAGGRYYRAHDVDVLAEIFAELASLERKPIKTDSMRIPVQRLREPSIALFAAFCVWIFLSGFILRRPLV